MMLDPLRPRVIPPPMIPPPLGMPNLGGGTSGGLLGGPTYHGQWYRPGLVFHMPLAAKGIVAEEDMERIFVKGKRFRYGAKPVSLARRSTRRSTKPRYRFAGNGDDYVKRQYVPTTVEV